MLIKSGNVDCSNINIKSGKINLKDTGETGVAVFSLQNENNSNKCMQIYSSQISGKDEYGKVYITPQMLILEGTESNTGGSIQMSSDGLYVIQDTHAIFYAMANTGEIYAEDLKYKTIAQTSLEAKKKNIEKLDIEAIELIKNSEIYEYNYKDEKDDDKKHIGFVIGKTRRTPNIIISKNNDGIDIYAMESILWKAMQEQQEQIESLQRKIKEMEEDKCD